MATSKTYAIFGTLAASVLPLSIAFADISGAFDRPGEPNNASVHAAPYGIVAMLPVVFLTWVFYRKLGKAQLGDPSLIRAAFFSLFHSLTIALGVAIIVFVAGLGIVPLEVLFVASVVTIFAWASLFIGATLQWLLIRAA